MTSIVSVSLAATYAGKSPAVTFGALAVAATALDSAGGLIGDYGPAGAIVAAMVVAYRLVTKARIEAEGRYRTTAQEAEDRADRAEERLAAANRELDRLRGLGRTGDDPESPGR